MLKKNLIFSLPPSIFCCGMWRSVGEKGTLVELNSETAVKDLSRLILS